MRQPQQGEARRSHLMPCPGCGAANGITAVACWQCDRQLLAPPPRPRQAPPPTMAEPPTLAETVVESELPTIAPDAGPATGWPDAEHGGARRPVTMTAAAAVQAVNDALFAPAPSRHLRMFAAATAVAVVVVAPIAFGVFDRPVEQAQTQAQTQARDLPVTSGAGTRQAAAAQNLSHVVAPPPASVLPSAPAPRSDAPVAMAAVAADAAAPQATPAPKAAVSKATGDAVRRARPAARGTPRRAAEARSSVAQTDYPPARPADAEPVPRPAPVPGKCTPQVAALALCTLDPN